MLMVVLIVIRVGQVLLIIIFVFFQPQQHITLSRLLYLELLFSKLNISDLRNIVLVPAKVRVVVHCFVVLLDHIPTCIRGIVILKQWLQTHRLADQLESWVSFWILRFRLFRALLRRVMLPKRLFMHDQRILVIQMVSILSLRQGKIDVFE